MTIFQLVRTLIGNYIFTTYYSAKLDNEKNLIETVSIDTTVLKAFTFLLAADLSSKLTNEPTNDQDRIYIVLLRTACYALTEWFYTAWLWLKNGTA